MTCPTREELAAVLDGDPGLAAASTHAEGCAACRAELARLAAGVALLRAGSPAPEPSPLFAARLSARLAALPRRRRGGLAALLLGTPLRLAAAGGLAAALAVGFVVAQRSRAAEELAAADRLELLQDLEVVASVGDVETADDAEVVAALGDLGRREGRP